MSRSLVGASVAACALTVAVGGVAVAGPVPGPKQLPEHAAISGGFFQAKSGSPGCFTGAGTLGAPFPVPGGAVVTAATVYVIDGQSSANVSVALNKHDMTSGATFELARGNTTGVPGTTKLDLVVPGGAVVAEGQAINMSVTVGDGTCFKGAEIHYFRSDSSTDSFTDRRAAARGFSPAGEPG